MLSSDKQIWLKCLNSLKGEVPEKLFNTWIRPIQSIEEEDSLQLLAPNNFVLKKVNEDYIERIKEIVLSQNSAVDVSITVGSRDNTSTTPEIKMHDVPERKEILPSIQSRLNSGFTFDAFVEGKSNQLAKAAAIQVSENLGNSYNPLFIYGGVGLGKTHLMQAVGNAVMTKQPGARVSYVHSERFVGDMVRGLQHNTISDFKRSYRPIRSLKIRDCVVLEPSNHISYEPF